jgi:hypothetical protein
MEEKGFERVSFLCSGLALATVAVAACSDAVRPPGESDLTALCEELQRDLITGTFKDAIPALSDPSMIPADHRDADYLLPTDRVIGIEIDGEYLAFPHNILWWHEIVNMNALGLAVTYCPLTGSSMVFRRNVVDGVEFGVSGFLFKNNLVMYDRTGGTPDSSGDGLAVGESLWPQMLAGGLRPLGGSGPGDVPSSVDRVGRLGGALSGHAGRDWVHEGLHTLSVWRL